MNACWGRRLVIWGWPYSWNLSVKSVFLLQSQYCYLPCTSRQTKCRSFNCSGQCHDPFTGCCGFADQWVAGIVAVNLMYYILMSMWWGAYNSENLYRPFMLYHSWDVVWWSSKHQYKVPHHSSFVPYKCEFCENNSVSHTSPKDVDEFVHILSILTIVGEVRYRRSLLVQWNQYFI